MIVASDDESVAVHDPVRGCTHEADPLTATGAVMLSSAPKIAFHAQSMSPVALSDSIAHVISDASARASAGAIMAIATGTASTTAVLRSHPPMADLNAQRSRFLR